MTHLLADAATSGNAVAVIFNSLGGLGGFIGAIIGVMIFLRDKKPKAPRRRPRKRANPGANNDHSSRPTKRISPTPTDTEDELSEDEDGRDAPDGDEDAASVDS